MLVYDPDGPGPIGERVLVSGNFTAAGTTAVQNLAVYDPATKLWSPFGAGPYPANLRLAGDPVGSLYVAGVFSSIAGVAAANVAHFDGATWSPLGTGVGTYIYDTVVLPNNDLVVCGSFSTAGGVGVNGIAVWDGSAWSALAQNPLSQSLISRLAVFPNGDLCASVNQNVAPWFRGVMRFDGTAWSQLGAGFGSAPFSLLVSPSGELFAGGSSVPGGGGVVARWDGLNWLVMPNAPFARAETLAMLPSGVLVGAGSQSSSAAEAVATWNGIAWTPIGSSVGAIGSLSSLASGEVLAGGSVSVIDGVATGSCARWNGVAWSALSDGLPQTLHSLAALPDGSLFAAAASGWQTGGLVSRWNGVSWTPVGGGFSFGASSAPNMAGLFVLSNGDLMACGRGGEYGNPGPAVQRWDGANWVTVATGEYVQVNAVVRMPNGDLVVAGQFQALDGVPLTNIGRFDGSSWSEIGNGLPAGIGVLRLRANGDLLALRQSSVFRWNGTAWTQLGLNPGGTAHALEIGADDQPLLGGAFPSASVLRWNGSYWAPLGTGQTDPVQSMAVLPNGDVIASPMIDANAPPRSVVRWDGVSWTALGGPVDGTVYATAVTVTGDVVLGGEFSNANGAVRARFARISTSCPAGVQFLGSGCGYWAPVLTAAVLPWLGATSRSTATNLSNASLAVIVSGQTQTSTPLASLLPTAPPGCLLLLAPDVLQLAVPSAGSVAIELDVPNVVGLLGLSFGQQVIALELDSAGAITTSRSSNALIYQVGAF